MKNPDVELSSIPDLPKAACELLDRDFVRFTSTVEQCQLSSDGTRKLLIRLQDGLKVESVIMVYDTGTPPSNCTVSFQPEEHSLSACDAAVCSRVTDEGEEETGKLRSTLCISSQVGCQMGCTFCATGVHTSGCYFTGAQVAVCFWHGS